MRTVNIGISHDDDLMITKFGDIKIFGRASQTQQADSMACHQRPVPK